MAYKYAFEAFDKASMARSHGTNLAISLKKGTEVAREIQGKKVSSVIKYLEGVMDQEMVIPYRRYRSEMPHKRGKGIAAGGFPVKVAEAFLKLVKNAEKNASEQEISGNLYIISASVRKGSRRFHMGRNMGRQIKSTTVEVVVGTRK